MRKCEICFAILIIGLCVVSCVMPVSRGSMHIFLGQDSHRVEHNLNYTDAFFTNNVNLSKDSFTLTEGNKYILVLSSRYPPDRFLAKSEYDFYDLIILLDTLIQNDTIDLATNKIRILFCREKFPSDIAEVGTKLNGHFVLISGTVKEIKGYIAFHGQTQGFRYNESFMNEDIIYGYVDCRINFNAVHQNRKQITSYLNTVLPSINALRKLLEQ